jgi:peptidoglycan/LPS O-acetylase OafA/YrhL
MFAFGALLSLNLRGRLPIIGAFIRAALFLSGFGCWLAAARWTAIFPGAAHAVGGVFGVIIGYLVSGGGCVLIFLSAYGADARWIPKSLVYLGKISYGMYVFHQLSLDTAAWILNRFPETATESHHIRFGIAHLGLGFIVSVLGAALSYKYFERPFLRLKAKFAVVPSRAP